jgi:hypothetical protein
MPGCVPGPRSPTLRAPYRLPLLCLCCRNCGGCSSAAGYTRCWLLVFPLLRLRVLRAPWQPPQLHGRHRVGVRAGRRTRLRLRDGAGGGHRVRQPPPAVRPARGAAGGRRPPGHRHPPRHAVHSPCVAGACVFRCPLGRAHLVGASVRVCTCGCVRLGAFAAHDRGVPSLARLPPGRGWLQPVFVLVCPCLLLPRFVHARRARRGRCDPWMRAAVSDSPGT